MRLPRDLSGQELIHLRLLKANRLSFLLSVIVKKDLVTNSFIEPDISLKVSLLNSNHSEPLLLDMTNVHSIFFLPFSSFIYLMTHPRFN